MEKGDSWKLSYYTGLYDKKVTKPGFQSRPPDFSVVYHKEKTFADSYLGSAIRIGYNYLDV